MCCGIDVDASNRIYVVWVEGNVIKLRIFSDGNWNPPFTISSGGSNCDAPKVAVDLQGNIFAIWWTSDGIIWSKARVNGVWENIRLISESGRRSKFPDIAVGYQVAYACWVAISGSLYQAAYAQRNKSFDASWSSVRQVSPSNLSQQHAVVELDLLDEAHIIWTSVLSEAGTRVVHYSHGTGGGFSSPEEISSTQVLHYPSLYERSNNLYACWQVGSYGAGLGIFYNAYQSGGWSGEASVPESGGSTFSDIAADPEGDKIYFVWDAGEEIYFYSSGAGPGPGPGPNKPPVAEFTFSPATGDFPLEVTFDASASYDPDGQIVRYEWIFGDGGLASGKVVKHTFTYAGTFSNRLIVVDNKGGVGSKVKTIEILKPNIPPVAEFTFSPTTGIFPLEVTFDASVSYDSDGQIVRYDWNFGDGGYGSGKVIKHTYNRWGTFFINLTVVDNRGGVGNKMKTIEVLRLFQPLNIRWETFTDESLFLSRYIIEVYWDRNPKNEGIAEIVKYRIYRKETNEDNKFYSFIGEVKGDTYKYRDYNVKEKNIYAYTVTALDRQGHESPLENVSSGQNNLKGNLKNTKSKTREIFR